MRCSELDLGRPEFFSPKTPDLKPCVFSILSSAARPKTVFLRGRAVVADGAPSRDFAVIAVSWSLVAYAPLGSS